jgi:8-oxo-dGTP diphosphatase
MAADGQPRWGRFGAAGVLVRHVDGDDHWYFLARRSEYTHLGGTWAIPGGALNEDETPLEAALREFGEEIGIALPDHVVVQVHEGDHGGWSYWTVVVDVTERFDAPTVLHWETADARWVRREELAGLELFAAFAETMELLGLS